MKKAPTLRGTSAGLLLVGMLLVGASGCCGVVRCVPPPCAPCDIEALLVDETVFPQGWTQQGLPDPRGAPVSFGVERIGIDFSTSTSGVAVQDVYRAYDARAASAGFHDFASEFSVREGETGWTMPRELTYRSQVVDQFRLGCSTHRTSGTQRCLFVGQYGVYLVRFHAYISSDMMTYEDMEHILQDIDRRMAECLDR
jgi:hypothetical protein